MELYYMTTIANEWLNAAKDIHYKISNLLQLQITIFYTFTYNSQHIHCETVFEPTKN